MKKREGGYVLPYVLVVVTLLSVIVVTVSTMAVRNLKAQQAELLRTQQLYEAEGEIEAYIDDVINAAEMLDSVTSEGLKSALQSSIEVEFSGISANIDDTAATATVTVTSTSGTVAVTAQLEFTFTLYAAEDEEATETKYTVTSVTVEYKSYEIGTCDEEN